MNDHDRNLIAAYAEGSLDSAEAGAARRLIDESAEARREHELQLAALDALRSAAAVTLDDTERSRLRQAVSAELHIARAAEPSPRRRRIRAFPWQVAAAAAAVVLVIAVGGPLLNTLSTSGDAADTTAAAGDAAVTQDGPTEAIEDEAEFSAAATTVAPAADLGQAPSASAVPPAFAEDARVFAYGGEISDADLQDLLLATRQRGLVEAPALLTDRNVDRTVRVLDESVCREELATARPDDALVPYGAASVDGVPSVLWFALTPAGEIDLLVADAADCDPIDPVEIP